MGEVAGTRTPSSERPHIRAASGFNSDGCPELCPTFPPFLSAPRPTLQASYLACRVWFNILRPPFSSPEQHAVQELTKAAMSGVGIDGEVLSYLELAQVCISLLFTF